MQYKTTKHWNGFWSHCISASFAPTTRLNGYSSFPRQNSITTPPLIAPLRHPYFPCFMAMNPALTPLWERPSSLLGMLAWHNILLSSCFLGGRYSQRDQRPPNRQLRRKGRTTSKPSYWQSRSSTSTSGRVLVGDNLSEKDEKMGLLAKTRTSLRLVVVKDARLTQTYSFLPASWAGNAHEETDFLPIGDREAKEGRLLVCCIDSLETIQVLVAKYL